MALIRGVNSGTPCPRCLVKSGEMADPSVNSQRRTTAVTQATIEKARQKKFVGECEEILKSAGLRNVEVSYGCFDLIYVLMAFPRTYFGRLETLIHILHYHLIGSIHFLVAYFGTISGHIFKNI